MLFGRCIEQPGELPIVRARQSINRMQHIRLAGKINQAKRPYQLVLNKKSAYQPVEPSFERANDLPKADRQSLPFASVKTVQPSARRDPEQLGSHPPSLPSRLQTPTHSVRPTRAMRAFGQGRFSRVWPSGAAVQRPLGFVAQTTGEPLCCDASRSGDPKSQPTRHQSLGQALK